VGCLFFRLQGEFSLLTLLFPGFRLALLILSGPPNSHHISSFSAGLLCFFQGPFLALRVAPPPPSLPLSWRPAPAFGPSHPPVLSVRSASRRAPRRTNSLIVPPHGRISLCLHTPAGAERTRFFFSFDGLLCFRAKFYFPSALFFFKLVFI